MLKGKKLGFGLMRLPVLDSNNPAAIDFEQVKKMVDTFIENGFTYFDTAWMYHGFKSEDAVKEFLVDRYPREAFTLATKIHFNYVQTEEDLERTFRTQLEKTGVEYFDYYLLHDMGAVSYDKYKRLKAFQWILHKKKSGDVKHIGFSSHASAELLDKVLYEHPEMEFVQLQLNYLDWEDEIVQAGKCYNVARKHNKPIIVMEPVKGGTLVNLPEEAESLLRKQNPEASIASWAIRYAASLKGVAMVLSGMSNLAQMEDNIKYMKEFKPLNEEEIELLKTASGIINKSITIPCTGCGYCSAGCPAEIPIMKYFSIYNGDMREDDKKEWTVQDNIYRQLVGKYGKPQDCIECGKCEEICPQHLSIIKELKNVREHFKKALPKEK